jgi:hypothetical protein
VKRDDTAVLVGPDGEELATIADFDAVVSEGRIDEFPAYYTYDPRTDQYTVHEHGQHHRYDEKADLLEEWIPVKEPFIPQHELPIPNYDPETYAILVVGSHDEMPVTDGDSGADLAMYRGGELYPLERLVDALQTGELHPPTTGPTNSEVVDADRRPPGEQGPSNEAEAVASEGMTPDPDELTPKQSSVADFVRFLDGGAPDKAEASGDSELEGLRSDHVLEVYQEVETELGRPVYQRRSDLSRELSKYVDFASKEERDPTTPEERYTRWMGLRWTNASVNTIGMWIRSSESRNGGSRSWARSSRPRGRRTGPGSPSSAAARAAAPTST